MDKPKKSLLAQWKSRKKSAASPEILRHDTPSSFLSTGQERLYFLQQLYPQNPFYHYVEAYKFQGNCDIDGLKKSFQNVIDETDIFKSVFYSTDQGVRQKYKTAIELRFDHTFSIDIAATSIFDKVRNWARQPFDLTNGPLLRYAIFEKTSTEIWVFICLHHIIIDKWSMDIFRKRWAAYYKHYKGDSPIVPEPPGLQYSDYIYWSRKREINQKNLDFWKQKLNPLPTKISLPTDFPTSVTKQWNGGYVTHQYSDELSKVLTIFSKENEITLYVTFLTAFILTQHVYSGSLDVSVGSPFSNRTQKQLESILGFFNETIVLRTTIDPSETIKKILLSVHQTVQEAFDHADLPFEELVASLDIDRDPGSNPLFSTMFLYHKVEEVPDFGPAIDFHQAVIDLKVSKFDLTLYISNDNDALSAIFEYDADLFEEDTIHRIHGHIEHVLHQIVESSAKTIAQLTILPPPERFKIKRLTHSTVSENSNVLTVLDLLKKNSSASTIAVELYDECITYQEFNQQTDLLAQFLIKKGAAPGDFIGLMAKPSIEMIVGIFGILKAGAAYVPLDPNYPENRINFIVGDAKMDFVLSDSNSYSWVGKPTYSIRTSINEIAPDSKINLPSVGPSALAYVIYTSGSSGVPKGVKINHSNLCFSTQARQYYYPKKLETFLLLSSFAFDSSVAGIFWSICSGGRLLLAPRRIEQDINALAEYIYNKKATHTLLLPSLYQMLLNYADINKIGSLNTVIVAGEACKPSIVHAHFERMPGVELYNEYGPTEATVWSTVYKIENKDYNTVPIGQVIPGGTVFILNNQGHICPINVEGELCIAGPNLSAGYLNLPERAAVSFIQHPELGRLYKTGDRALLRANGNIEFRGRIDQQVKIRGHRIELTAVENALQQQNEIIEAIIKTHENTQGRLQLIAFIESKDKLETSKIRSAMGAVLPDYMVPDIYEIVHEWPRLPNGKINRNKLELTKTLSDTAATPSTNYSDKQSALIQALKSVLKLDQIELSDHYFRIGGDSITSIQLIAKLRNMGYRLKPENVFKYPMLEDLAAHISQLEKKNTAQDLRKSSPLHPIQQWFFSTHKIDSHFWNQGFSIRVKSRLDHAAIRSIFHYLIEVNPSLRHSFRLSNHEVQLQEDINPRIETLTLGASLDALKPSQAITDRLLAIQQTFNFDGGLVGVLNVYDPNNQYLYIVIHHLVIDAVSWMILLNDLDVLIGQYEKGESLYIPKSGNTYFQAVEFLKEWTSTHRSKYVDFWSKQLVAEPPVEINISKLPFAEQAVLRLESQCDSEVTFAINNAQEKLNCSVQEILLASFAHAYCSFFRQSELPVFLEHQGRDLPDNDFSYTTGWFTSFFPLLLQWNTSETWKLNLNSLKEVLRPLPLKGAGFGAMNTFESTIWDFEKHLPHIVFNYLGRQATTDYLHFDSVAFLANGTRSPLSENAFWLELNIRQTDRHFLMNWAYNPEVVPEQTIQKFINAYESAILDLLSYVEAQSDVLLNPADFPDSNLDQTDLDALFS